jgi:predicted alpha/beta superfamily hydrolase
VAVREHTSDVIDLGAATVPWSASHRFRSAIVPQDYLIEVAWPPARLAPGARAPAVIVLDGNHSFALAALAARALQGGPNPMPRTFVIGVGYHFGRPEDYAQWARLRVRDFSPCSDPLHESQTPGFSSLCGGADAFRRFIEEELKPFLAADYPVDLDDLTLVGASAGGLFTLYTLFTRPEAFRRYVAISPALYWGDRMLFELEARTAAAREDLAANVFLAAGGLEEAHDRRQRFVSNLYELEAGLRARRYPSLDLRSRIFEGETHMSVFPGALTYGLGAVFGGYPDLSDWSRWLRTG